MKDQTHKTGKRPVAVWSRNGRNAVVAAVKEFTHDDEQALLDGARIKVGNVIFTYRKGTNELSTDH